MRKSSGQVISLPTQSPCIPRCWSGTSTPAESPATPSSFPPTLTLRKAKISILAPIATALLGYREGDEIEWPTPGGRRRFKVIKVLYQPEAAGDEPRQY